MKMKYTEKALLQRTKEASHSELTAPNWGQLGILRLNFPSTWKPKQTSTAVSLWRNTIATKKILIRM